jgi:hypothetical protein
MRIEDKFVVRVSDKPGSSVPAIAPDAPPPPPAPATTADVDAAVTI